MKKIGCKLLIVFGTLFSSQLFAGFVSPCPTPAQAHRHGIFQTAEGPSVWTLTSLPFRANGFKWVITYRTSQMLRVLNENEAVRQGQDLFNHVKLQEPITSVENNQVVCLYTDNSERDVVRAEAVK